MYIYIMCIYILCMYIYVCILCIYIYIYICIIDIIIFIDILCWYIVIVPGCFRSPRPLWFSPLSWRRHRAVCSTSKADRNGRTGQCWGANNMKLWSYQVSTELSRRKLFPIKYCLVSCWVQTRTNVSEQLNWAHRLKSILSNSSDQKAQAQQGSILCVCIYIYMLYCSSTKKMPWKKQVDARLSCWDNCSRQKIDVCIQA